MIYTYSNVKTGHNYYLRRTAKVMFSHLYVCLFEMAGLAQEIINYSVSRLTRLFHSFPSRCGGVSVSNIQLNGWWIFMKISGYEGYGIRNNLKHLWDDAVNLLDRGFIFLYFSRSVFVSNGKTDGWIFMELSGSRDKEQLARLLHA